jgi:exosortase K
MKNKITLSILCFCIFAGLKLAYPHLDTDNIRFLLGPTNKAIELISGSDAIYNSASGYFYPQINMVINKSCSGYNFLLISFLMIAFVFIKTSIIKKWLVIPVSFLLAYASTLIANISRITGYMLIMNIGAYSSFGLPDKPMHQVEGIFVYLSFLIFGYLLLNQIINKIQRNHEKTAQS